MLRSLAALVALHTCAAALVPGDNILILVADDLGVDLVNVYQEATDLPPTPNLDSLAQQGVLFRNAWAYARCSPGRATIQTGRFGFRTGIGSNVNEQVSGWPLQKAETTLPEMLGPLYSSACFGKWHLHNGLVGGNWAPNLAGYPFYAGAMTPFRGGDDYFNYTKVINGLVIQGKKYACTGAVDDALYWISNAHEPWFCIVNFHLPHAPFHTPPPHLHSFPLPLPDDRTKLKAMVEAMDTEIGRLLTGMDPGVHSRTTVMFTGDNGTTGNMVVPPLTKSHAKGTLYEGGLNVPLIVAGASVVNPGREVPELVCSVDLFQTVADLAGADTSGLELDSISFLPHLRDIGTWQTSRHYAFAERFKPNGPGPKVELHWAIRDSRFKLIRHQIDGGAPQGPIDELYNLLTDPQEQVNLVPLLWLDPSQVDFQVLKHYTRLSAELKKILGS